MTNTHPNWRVSAFLRFAWVALAVSPLLPVHAQEPTPALIFAEDYSKPLTVSRKWDPTKSNIHDDTGYAGVKPEYTIVDEPQASGGKVMQIEVPGFLQTILGNVTAVKGRTYRIRLRLRCLGQQSVDVMVRRKPAPYRRYWTTTVQAGEAWRDYDLLGHVPAVYKGTEDNTACLMLMVKATTTLWIDSVEATELPPDYTPPPDPEPAPGNVLHNSGFELGFEGWYHHAAAEVVAGQGHSGGGALRLTGRQGLTSTWYKLARGRPYRVSAWCRFETGKGHVRLGPCRYVWPTGGVSILKSIPVGAGEWKKIGFDFTVPDALRASEPFFYLRIWNIPRESTGPLLVDDVVLCPAETDPAYTPRSAIELSVRSRAPKGVYLPGEDVQLDVRIWSPEGRPLPDGVQIALFDETNTEARCEPVALDGTQTGTCVIRDLPTGYWRVETRTGLPAADCAEGETFVVKTPLTPEIHDAVFSLGSHMSNDDAALRAAHRLGVRWDRFHDIMGTPTKWVSLEPTKGEWRTEEPRQVTMRRSSGTQMLGLIDRCPGWVQGIEGKDRRGRTRHFHAMTLRQEDIPAWRAYVHRTVTQFRNDIRAWEITNEPQHSARKKLPAGTPGQQYAMIAKAAAEEIRRADPMAKIIGVGGTNTHHKDFLNSLGEAGVFSLVDTISIHSYGTGAAPCGQSPASYMRCVESVRELVRSYTGKEVEIWDTESGIPIDSASRKFRTLPGQEAYSGAILFAKMLVARRAAGIRKWFLFHAKVQPDCCARGCGHYFELNNTVTPAGLTLAVAFHFLQTADFDRLEEKGDAGLVRVHFRRPEDRMTVVWSNQGDQSVPLPKGASAFSVWGRPVEPAPNGLMVNRDPVYIVQ